jgi:CRP-like cAMP-binding protein
MSVTVHFDNQLFETLPVADFELLKRHLRGTLLRARSVLFEPGELITRAWFPHGGAVSLTVVLAGGQAVECATIGRGGIVGASGALLPEPATCRAVVEIETAATSLDIEALRQLADTRPAIRTLLLRHEASLMAKTRQIAACNAAHSLEARLCRWLLTARDACGGTVLAVTQERIAELLGVRRTSICLIAHMMQTAGLIRTRRGQIEIIDETALRARACECHGEIAAYGAHLRAVPAREMVEASIA